MGKTAINNLETYVNIQNIKFKYYDRLKKSQEGSILFHAHFKYFPLALKYQDMTVSIKKNECFLKKRL